MLTTGDIKTIVRTLKASIPRASKKFVAFGILCSVVEDKHEAYRLVFNTEPEGGFDAFMESEGISELFSLLRSFGIGAQMEATISREENTAGLISLMQHVQDAYNRGELEEKDYAKLMTDIRVKLNDKFDVEASQKERRIIVVPQKHDIVCPHTHRECSQMPSKEACMDYYNLH